MLYIVAIIVPPLAILLSGKIFQAVFNALLLIVGLLILVGTLGIGHSITFVFWIIAIVHAVIVVNGRNQAARDQRIIDALKDKE